eukprot:416977_1
MVSLYISVFSLFIASISISDKTTSQACSDKALVIATNDKAHQIIGASITPRYFPFIDNPQRILVTSSSFSVQYSLSIFKLMGNDAAYDFTLNETNYVLFNTIDQYLSFASIENVSNSAYPPYIRSHVNQTSHAPILEMNRACAMIVTLYISILLLFMIITSMSISSVNQQDQSPKFISVSYIAPPHVLDLCINLIGLAIVSTLVIPSTALYSSTRVSGSYPTILPRQSDEMAVGYDAANHTILILAGFSSGQFVTFKDGVFTDYGSSYLNDGTTDFYARGHGQYYTQMSNTLWYINCMFDGKLVTFDTTTYKTFAPDITIPIRIVEDTNYCNARSCLTSLDNGKHQYLFVIGFDGLNWSQGDKVQIYNISSSHWLSQSYVPNMNKKRESLSCVVYNERLYAIGGREPFSGSSGNPLDTVESLYVGADLSNINNALWLYVNGVLSQTMSGTRAVVHHEFHSIIVIPAVFQVDVNIINTVDSSISFAGTLTQGTTTAASIIVDDLLYLFGGNANGYRVDTYQYINLLTLAPTASSNAPSNAPSDAPSNAPSKPPSKAPSSAPSNAPSDAPSNAPTAPTNVPSNAPSNAPSTAPSLPPSAAPSLPPSLAPSLSPSLAPSLAPSLTPSDTPSSTPSLPPSSVPSLAPSFAPSLTPSLAPSIAPSSPPSIAPSFSPSLVPSNAPTLTPSVAPSNVPSSAPSLAPSSVPSLAPTSPPSIAPSFAPSNAPSLAPSKVPSHAPTNNPIASDDFDSTIEITYLLEGVNSDNKKTIAYNPINVSHDLETVIKKEYVDDDPISYDALLIDIERIQNNKISKINDKTLTQWTDLDSLQLQTHIECNEWSCASIKEQSKLENNFANSVSITLQTYFNNTNIEFKVHGDASLLNIVPKYASNASKPVDYVLYGISSVCGLFGCIGVLAFLFNKGKIPTFPGANIVDDGQAGAVFIFTLQFWDFYSDINLSVEIWNHPQLNSNMTLLISAIGSTFFLLVPYVANLLMASKIKQIISNNHAAKGYFNQNTPIFTIFVVISGGCYPALALVSSAIFGLEILTSGLTRYDLKRMSRLKLIGTVLLENLPQLICQVLYAYAINEITQGVQLAFIASSLSVIASTLSYLINREISDTVVVQYYLVTECNDRSTKHGVLKPIQSDKEEEKIQEDTLEIESISPPTSIEADTKSLTDNERDNIIDNRGRTMCLAESIAEVFGIQPKYIEIGYTMITKCGFITHIVHYVDQEDLDLMEQEAQHPDTISALYFAEQLFLSLQSDITTVMRQHFNLNTDFETEYTNRSGARIRSAFT